jgi:short-subunit dehydrogenase involved in D-alanine esterification of teichoic acids
MTGKTVVITGSTEGIGLRWRKDSMPAARALEILG